MHGLAVYVKEGLPFEWGLSVEHSADSYLYLTGFTSSVSYFFFFNRSPSLFSCTVFDAISSNVDEVPLINPSVNVFVFGDFNVHLKNWLTYSGGANRPGELCYNFSISNDITWMVKFVTLTVLLFWIYFSFDTIICSTMAFPPLGNSDHAVVSVCIDFLTNSKQDAPFQSF